MLNETVTKKLQGLSHILTEPEIAYTGWQDSLAKMKAYYVRGLSSFYREYNCTLASLEGYEEGLESLLFDGRNWQETNPSLPWNEKWSYRMQAKLILSPDGRKPVKFLKAVQAIMVCEQFAAAAHSNDPSLPPPQRVYELLTVQPAIYYVSALTADIIDRMKQDDPLIMDKLEKATGQVGHQVFYDMALKPDAPKGKCRSTVTKSLAEGVFDFLKQAFGTTAIGRVDYRYDADLCKDASFSEFIDFT